MKNSRSDRYGFGMQSGQSKPRKLGNYVVYYLHEYFCLKNGTSK